MLRHHCPPGGEDAVGRQGGTPVETPGSELLIQEALGTGTVEARLQQRVMAQCPSVPLVTFQPVCCNVP